MSQPIDLNDPAEQARVTALIAQAQACLAKARLNIQPGRNVVAMKQVLLEIVGTTSQELATMFFPDLQHPTP